MRQDKIYSTPILTLANKHEKNTPKDIKNHANLIYQCLGHIEGILNCYEQGGLDSFRALDDMRDVVDFYNEEHAKYMEKL